MDVKMPDGTIIKNVPEGTTQEDLQASYNAHQFNQGKSSEVKAGTNPLMEMALAASSGMMRGGPLLGMFGESQKQAGQLLEKGAYNVGGAITDAASGNVSPENAARMGFAGNVATQAIPSFLFGKVVEKVSAPTMKGMGRTLMEQSVKPAFPDWKSGKGARAIETMLEEGISPTKGGVEKLRGFIDDLEKEIDTAVKNSTAMVNKVKVGQELRGVFDQFRKRVNPDASLDAIKKAWGEFNNHPLLKGKTDFPVQLAHEMKKESYKALGDKAYGLGVKPEAAQEAEKALVRGLRKEVGAAVPEVNPLLSREGDLINALKVSQRRAFMDQNRTMLGMAPVAPSQTALIAMLLDSFNRGKSYAARGLYSGAERLPGTAGMFGAGSLAAEGGQVDNEPGVLYRYLRGLLPPR